MSIALEADLHTHTVASGHAFGTLNELIEAAQRTGLTMLGVTDHGPSMQGAPHAGYFDMSPRAPREILGVRVLMGVEANVIDLNGTLDLTPEQLAVQSLVLAGLHARTPYDTASSSAENTRALVRAMERYRVHVISHPFRSSLPVDVSQVARAAAKTDTLLEINISLMLLSVATDDEETIEQTRQLVEAARDENASCVVSSDAHFVQEVGSNSADLDLIWSLLGLDDSIVVNAQLAAAREMQK